MFRKSRYKIEQCPVCKESLGQRNTAIFFMAKCDECQFYFSWDPNQELPRAISAKEKDRKECGCSNCKR